MGAPKTTVWTLDPHTRAKHEILRRYLGAWTAILSLGGFRSIAYVDGFAGPGLYAGGEHGSPVIALNAALKHKSRISATLLFLFIERDADRAQKLEEVVSAIALPKNFHIKVVGGKTFEQGFREDLLEFYRRQRKGLPPTFAFIDPFGWTGVPFKLVREILSNDNCEVLINFMFEEINRFIAHPDQGKNFDLLFGTDEWRKVKSMGLPTERKAFLHGLYLRQLRETAQARYVRSFEMRNDKDVTDYFLFFATNSRIGIKKMKEAMWKVDQSGEFRFSDATQSGQTVLFTPEPDYTRLRRELRDRFAGQEATVDEIEEFVLADTPYRETHYKRQVLAPLEQEGGLVAINPPEGRRAGTFADPSLKLRFDGKRADAETRNGRS